MGQVEVGLERGEDEDAAYVADRVAEEGARLEDDGRGEVEVGVGGWHYCIWSVWVGGREQRLAHVEEAARWVLRGL